MTDGSYDITIGRCFFRVDTRGYVMLGDYIDVSLTLSPTLTASAMELKQAAAVTASLKRFIVVLLDAR